MKRSLFVLGCSALLCAGIAGAPDAPPSAGYAVVNKIPLAGDGGWDYCTVDAAAGRLFVSHESQVQVVDAATLQQAGAVPGTGGVHGIALVHEANKAYISCGDDTAVAVVDLPTLTSVGKIHVTGLDPDAVIYDPFSRCVMTCNGKSDNATLIDTRNDSVVATIPLGGKPEYAASNGSGFVYVNLEDKNAVAEINMKTMKVEHRWNVAPGKTPSTMAIDRESHRLFVGCRSKLAVVMDAANGKVIASLPIGDHVDAAVYDSALQRAFFSNGDGTITVIGRSGNDGYAVVGTIATQRGAKTMALNPETHHLYLPTAEYGKAPAPTPDHPRPKAAVVSGSFMVLEVAPVAK
jgi:YVTN family beta-propeller protein